MVTAAKQMGLVGIDADDEAAEIEAENLWREELFSACRQCVRDLGGYEHAAAALDRRWGPKGRPVSASLLRAALNDAERNYFRGEWLAFFKGKSADVARILAAGMKPKKTPEELLADLEAELREELSHKRVEQIIRKARAR
jgi:hypothetical protein